MQPNSSLRHLKMQAQRRLKQCHEVAQAHFGRHFVFPEISFDLRGMKAGVAYLQQNLLKFNPVLLQENPQEFIQQVVPHELAHLLVYQLYGRVKPHGKEWQGIMRELFGLPPDTCHQFDIRSVQGETFAYACQCQVHHLSKRRHLRIQRDQREYICRKCQETLRFTGEKA